MTEDQITKTEVFAKNCMSLYDSSHDWLHITRVRKCAAYINMNEHIADPFLLDIAAIMHDIADHKFTDPEAVYPDLENFLQSAGLSHYTEKVLSIIKHVSFSSEIPVTNHNPELLIIQDADRLDAIGAVGIARAFSYGGFRNLPFYGFENDKKTILRHFDDKLLMLKNLMNTDTGKRLAVDRHNFLIEFLLHFDSEIKFCEKQP